MRLPKLFRNMPKDNPEAVDPSFLTVKWSVNPKSLICKTSAEAVCEVAFILIACAALPSK